jgi:hypothetical protein
MHADRAVNAVVGDDHDRVGAVLERGGDFVPGHQRAAVAARISRDLFFADFPAHQQRLSGDVAPEFAEALYASAVRSPP